MEYNPIGKAVQDSFESMRQYIDDQVKYNKLLLAKKLGDITSYFALLFFVSALSGALLLFLSFAFAFWFADITNLNVYTGYLVVSLLYGLIIFLIIKYREKVLFSPVRKLLGGILFDVDEDDVENPFSTSEKLRTEIHRLHEAIQSEKKNMALQLKELNDSLTLNNLSQQVFKQSYRWMLNSGKMAKIAFKLVKQVRKRHQERKANEK